MAVIGIVRIQAQTILRATTQWTDRAFSTVPAPGFDRVDFKLGNREELIGRFPQF